MKPFLFAANWKMYLSANQERSFFEQHRNELIALAQNPGITIALFPSFVSLAAIGEHTKKSPLKLGAQDCSAHVPGAYTGQVSATSLTQVGCTYAIIGHNERRMLNESADVIAQKAARLFEANLQPIICVGETAQERQEQKTNAVIAQQLLPFVAVAATAKKPFFVAYEPVWAIGSGTMPTALEIEAVFRHITTIIEPQCQPKDWSLLYGGSVTSAQAPSLYAINQLGGLLIGGASIDFQEFKKIVLSKNSLKS